jgi:hypothetical protein
MRPAFSSPRHVAAFGLVLALLLALPELVAKTGWLNRRDVYPAIPWKYGPFPWIQQKIFDETGDVDVVFMGSSHIWNGVDAPYVQQRFSEYLGRDAKVFSLCWPWPGLDALYIIARDLLDHRHVRMLVVYDLGGVDVPQMHSARWFRIGENSEALAGLPWLSQLSLYGGAVLSMPRQLLSVVRPNLLDDPTKVHATFWDTYYRAPNIAQQLGTLRTHLGWDVSPNFVPFHAHGNATPADVVIYSPETRDAFQFSSAVHAYQLRFAQKLARLCQQRKTRLVVLKMPLFGETGPIAVDASELSPGVLDSPIDIIGIPGERLFGGLSVADVQKLFYDPGHFNENGLEMFTPLITPTLLKLYADTIHR